MKTKRVFEKTSRLWMPLSVFLLTLVMAVSCQQEGEDMHNEENDRATELQLWLAKNYPDATFSVDWAKHSEYVAEGYTISRVAVISSVGEYGINRQAAAENKDERYLNHPVWLEALHGNSGEILNAYIYAVIPSVAYMENHSFSYDDIGLYNLKDFEGDMPMYRLDGAPIQLKIFADGKHVKDILPTKSKSIDNEGGIFAKRMGSGGGGEWPSCKNYHGMTDPGGFCPVCGESACFWCGKIGCEGCMDACSICGMPGCKDCPPPICESCGGLKSQCTCVKVCYLCGAALTNCQCDKTVDPGDKGPGGNPSGTGEGDPANYCGSCMRMLKYCDCEVSRCFNCFAPYGTCKCFTDPG